MAEEEEVNAVDDGVDPLHELRSLAEVHEGNMKLKCLPLAL